MLAPAPGPVEDAQRAILSSVDYHSGSHWHVVAHIDLDRSPLVAHHSSADDSRHSSPEREQILGKCILFKVALVGQD